MGKMKELYQKVANDADLQAKFSDILSNAEKSGIAETEKKLLNFAQEQGFDISINEMREFFRSLAETNSDELSETELDMVAGGKGSSKTWGAILGGTILAGSVVAGATGAGAAVSVGCVVGAGVTEGAMS